MKNLVFLLAILLVAPGIASAIPNPSAVYCVEQGYEYEIRTNPDGGQYGVCIFPDGSECSAWQYYCKCEPNGIGCWPGDFNCDFPCEELACREAGEFVSISNCCEGFNQIPRKEAYDDKCHLIGYLGWLFICSDCGNGICECWESICNCPQDCAPIRNITQNTYYERIQDAIDDANDGDIIEIQPGTYTGDGNRDIDFLGKAITVRSTDPEDPCIVAATVIDCENIAGHRGFYFRSGEGPNSILSGFTIKGGRIENSVAEGGGIFCYGSSPTIEYCTVTNNTVISTNSETYSSSALILPIDPNTPITIGPTNPIEIPIFGPNTPIPGPIIIVPSPEPNIIIITPGPSIPIPGPNIPTPIPGPIIIVPSPEPNIIIITPGPGIPIPGPETLGYAAGGGICIKSGLPISDQTSSNPTIYKCRIVNNKVDGGNSTGQWSTLGLTGGGGIACMNGRPVIIDCLISNNTARGADGIDTEAGGSVRGGGIMGDGPIIAVGQKPVIIDCLISNNTARGGDGTDTENGGSAFGGGISGPAAVINNIINNNTVSAVDGGYACGGGIYGAATVTNSIINSNTASAGEGGGAHGGAIYYGLLGPTVINCTISKNTSVDGGIVVGGSYSTITNCILWDNIGSSVIDANESIIVYGQDPNVSTISISYNNVEGGYLGTDNIDANPCFVDPDNNDFHLLPNSPCTNTGNPNYIPEPNETDLDGNPRVNGGRIDMGAYEANYIEAMMKFTPPKMNCKSKGKFVKARITLPEGFTPEDVVLDTPVLIYPMNLESEYLEVFLNSYGSVELKIAFDRQAFCDSLTETGQAEVIVIGSSTTGQYFYATDTIKVKP